MLWFVFHFVTLTKLSTCVLFSLLCSLLLPSHHPGAQKQPKPSPKFSSACHTASGSQGIFWITVPMIKVIHLLCCPELILAKGHPSALCPSTDSVLWPPSEERLGSPRFPQSNACSLCTSAGASSGSGVVQLCFVFSPLPTRCQQCHGQH